MKAGMAGFHPVFRYLLNASFTNVHTRSVGTDGGQGEQTLDAPSTSVSWQSVTELVNECCMRLCYSCLCTCMQRTELCMHAYALPTPHPQLCLCIQVHNRTHGTFLCGKTSVTSECSQVYTTCQLGQNRNLLLLFQLLASFPGNGGAVSEKTQGALRILSGKIRRIFKHIPTHDLAS